MWKGQYKRGKSLDHIRNKDPVLDQYSIMSHHKTLVYYWLRWWMMMMVRYIIIKEMETWILPKWMLSVEGWWSRFQTWFMIYDASNTTTHVYRMHPVSLFEFVFFVVCFRHIKGKPNNFCSVHNRVMIWNSHTIKTCYKKPKMNPPPSLSKDITKHIKLSKQLNSHITLQSK